MQSHSPNSTTRFWWQEGQKCRLLQENASRYSWPQSLHLTRAKPLFLLNDFAVFQTNQTLDLIQQSLIMRGKDKRYLVSFIQLAHDFYDHAGSFGIEICCWFIGDHQRRVIHKRPGDGNPLAARAIDY